MNNMEIKQGDKVRVSSRLPRIYERFGSMIAPHYECKVLEIDDGMALLDSIPVKHVFLFPLKYLVKVDAEEKDAKFKKGDKVRYIGNDQPQYRGSLFIIDGDVFFNDYFNQWQASSIKTDTKEVWGICNVPLSDLEPHTEGATPTIKAGDRVRNIESGLIGVVDKIVYGNVVWVNGVDSKRYHWKSDELELVEPAEQTHQRATIISEGDIHSLDETPTNNVGSIKIPVEVDLTDSYWDAYAADLAKEVAVNNAKGNVDPIEIAEYAVELAKAVVEGLKRK